MPICPSDTTLCETSQSDVNQSDLETLQQRISELEEENANLRLLDEVVARNTALFEALLAHSSAGISLIGPHRRIVRVVRALDEFRAGDLGGAPLESLVHPDHHELLHDCFERLMQGRSERAEIEVRTYRPDGSLRWAAVTLTDMLDNPNVQAIVCNVDDITERKQAELIRAESAALAGASEWTVFSQDPDGKILTWNSFAERVFGYSAEEILGCPAEVLLPAHGTREDSAEFGNPGVFRSIRVRKDGEEISVLVKLGRVVDQNGHLRAISHLVKVLRVLSTGAGYPVPRDGLEGDEVEAAG